MNALVQARYTDNSGEEFHPDRYERASGYLIMWKRSGTDNGTEEVTILNYNSTRWVKITNEIRESSSPQYL